MSTYAEFNAAARAAVNADGEPENLVANHKNYVLDALIDLQIKVPCLRIGHVDFISASETFYACGASQFDAPRGFITKLSTMIPGDTCCREVAYTPVSVEDLDCMIANQQPFSFCSSEELHPPSVYLQGDVYVALPYTGTYCLDYVPYGDTTLDKASRAAEGFYTIKKGKILVTPQIQSDELLKLEWDGIKRSFADTDILDDEIFDREVAECVEMYLRARQSSAEDCDYTRAILFSNENMQRPGMYQVRRADLIHTCEKMSRPPKRTYCWDTCSGGGMFLGSTSSSSSSSSGSTAFGVTQVFFGVGDPNGVQTATKPAIFYTALGALWYKTGDGTNNTGWELSIASP